jgi:type I restriction enzyme S subunit
MSSEWKQVELLEIADFQNGYAFKSDEYVADLEGGKEVLRMGYIKRGGGFKEDEKPVFAPKRSKGCERRYELDEGDIVIAMTDMKDRVAILGNCARIPTSNRFALNQRVGRIRSKDEDLADQRFLYYHMNSPSQVQHLRSLANRGVQVNLTTESIIRSPVFLPPIKEQKAIAHILGTLDDKIELNRKTNETLEALAKALFKSWFVDFDPVRAKAEGRSTGLPDELSDLFPDSFEDSELGEIPSGWEVALLGEVLDVDKGVSYKGDFLSDSEGLPMVNLGCFAGGGAFRQEKMKFYAGEHRERHVAQVGDLLIANTDMTQNRIILGAPIIIPPWKGNQKFLFSHHTFAVRFKQKIDALKWYVYFTLLKPSFRQVAAGHATGTTVLALPKDGITDYQAVIPPSHLINEFAKRAEELFLKCQKADEQNDLLARLRDALLPKLISGEIRIPDAERMLEEVGV